MSGPRLSKRDRKALARLAELERGHYAVQPPFLDIARRSYLRLRAYGAFDEQWTWASHTRPDIALSDKGRALLAGDPS